MKPISMTIALGLVLICCGPAMAQQHAGPYVGAFLGGNILADAKSTDALGSVNLSYNPALQGSFVVGWDLSPDNSWGKGRVEIEYAHRGNSLDTVEFVEGKFPGSGSLKADSLLLNTIGIYRSDSPFSPYVMAGIGAARMDGSDMKVSGQPLATDATTVFAYQAGVGVDYTLTDTFSLDFGYRFFGTTQPKFTEGNGQKFETDYYSHSIVLGLRLGF